MAGLVVPAVSTPACLCSEACATLANVFVTLLLAADLSVGGRFYTDMPGPLVSIIIGAIVYYSGASMDPAGSLAAAYLSGNYSSLCAVVRWQAVGTILGAGLIGGDFGHWLGAHGVAASARTTRSQSTRKSTPKRTATSPAPAAKKSPARAKSPAAKKSPEPSKSPARAAKSPARARRTKAA